jgi:hypothetical protein
MSLCFLNDDVANKTAHVKNKKKITNKNSNKKKEKYQYPSMQFSMFVTALL